MNFAVKLRELLKLSGKLQKDICAELKIPAQKLTNWKTGYTEPCLVDLVLLANYFEITVDELLSVEACEHTADVYVASISLRKKLTQINEEGQARVESYLDDLISSGNYAPKEVKRITGRDGKTDGDGSEALP